MQRSAVSISWFLRSVWPLDWGWYPEDRLTVAPRSEQNSLQNTEGELGTPIRDHVHWDAVETDDVEEE